MESVLIGFFLAAEPGFGHALFCVTEESASSPQPRRHAQTPGPLCGQKPAPFRGKTTRSITLTSLRTRCPRSSRPAKHRQARIAPSWWLKFCRSSRRNPVRSPAGYRLELRRTFPGDPRPPQRPAENCSAWMPIPWNYPRPKLACVNWVSALILLRRTAPTLPVCHRCWPPPRLPPARMSSSRTSVFPRCKLTIRSAVFP